MERWTLVLFCLSAVVVSTTTAAILHRNEHFVGEEDVLFRTRRQVPSPGYRRTLVVTSILMEPYLMRVNGRPSTDDVDEFFRTSSVERYKEAYNRVREANTTVTSVREGVENVLNADDTPFVFVGESQALQKAVNDQPCELRLVGGHLNMNSYAFVVRKRSGMAAHLNSKIVQMVEDGFIRLLLKKWWKPSKCEESKDGVLTGELTRLNPYSDHYHPSDVLPSAPLPADHSTSPDEDVHIDLRRFALVLLLLFIGYILALVTCLLEICLHRKRKSPTAANKSPPPPSNPDQKVK